MSALGSHLPRLAKCIKLWNPDKTILQNLDYLRAKGLWKSSVGNLWHFARNNYLSFTSSSTFRKNQITSKWDPKKTILQNAVAIGISTSSARDYSLRLKLPYQKLIRGFACDIEKKALAMRLKEAGYTYQKIGLLFGSSRQNIEQLIRRRPKKIIKGQLESVTNTNSYKGRRK